MYIVLSLIGLLILVASLMVLPFCVVMYFTRPKKKTNKQTIEEKIWEQLKENRQDTTKNSSQ